MSGRARGTSSRVGHTAAETSVRSNSASAMMETHPTRSSQSEISAEESEGGGQRTSRAAQQTHLRNGVYSAPNIMRVSSLSTNCDANDHATHEGFALSR